MQCGFICEKLRVYYKYVFVLVLTTSCTLSESFLIVDTYHGFFFLLWQQTVGVKAELQMKSFYLKFKKKTLINLTGIQLCTYVFMKGDMKSLITILLRAC